MQILPNDFLSANLLRIKKYGKWGFENKQGTVVIPCKWKYAYEFSDGLAYVEDFSNNHFYIDTRGNIVIKCIWPWSDSFVGGFARVRNENMEYGFMDKTGSIVVPCQYMFVHRFSSKVALVQDKKGKRDLSMIWAKLLFPVYGTVLLIFQRD